MDNRRKIESKFHLFEPNSLGDVEDTNEPTFNLFDPNSLAEHSTKDADLNDAEFPPASISATQNVKKDIFNERKQPSGAEIKQDFEDRGLMNVKLIPSPIYTKSWTHKDKKFERPLIRKRKHGEDYVRDGRLNANEIKQNETYIPIPEHNSHLLINNVSCVALARKIDWELNYGNIIGYTRQNNLKMGVYEEDAKMTLGDYLVWDRHYNSPFHLNNFTMADFQPKVVLEGREYSRRGYCYKCTSCKNCFVCFEFSQFGSESRMKITGIHKE